MTDSSSMQRRSTLARAVLAACALGALGGVALGCAATSRPAARAAPSGPAAEPVAEAAGEPSPPAAPAAPRDDAPGGAMIEQEDRVEYEKRTVVDFSDVAIEGELTSPEASYVKNRKRTRFRPLVDKRPSFLGERAPDVLGRDWGTNPTTDTAALATSTFAVDVDTGSWAVARAWLERGALPQEDVVRVEEVVNALDYGYPAPEDGDFRVVAEAFPSPTRAGYLVLKIGVKAREVARADRKPANLVFVVDESGSTTTDGRLELLKRALYALAGELDERDTVSVVAYAEAARLVLPPTSGAERARVRAALAELQPRGGTDVSAGLRLGYRAAAAHARPGVQSRVVLCSDGMANLGTTDVARMLDEVAEEAARGVYLTTIGVGLGHYHDELLEQLADRGDGRYAYVDGDHEARRLFVAQLQGTLEVVAKDAKVQVELDPLAVARYRLLGYENRALAAEDFADDGMDGGEVGAGQAFTALYEVQLRPGADRFGRVRLRWQDPSGEAPARELVEELPMRIKRGSLAEASDSSRVALASALFAEKLRASPAARSVRWLDVARLLSGLPKGALARADVAELRALVDRAAALDRREPAARAGDAVAASDLDVVLHAAEARRAP